MNKAANKCTKPTKRNSDARREQNRLASRNYREKRKQKLALLDQLLDVSNVESSQNAGDQEEATDIAVTNLEPVVDIPRGEPVVPSSLNATSEPLGNIWGDLPDSSIVSIDPLSFLDQLLPPDSASNQTPGSDIFATWSTNPSTIITESSQGQPSLGQPQASLDSSSRDISFLNVLKGVENLTAQQKQALLGHLLEQTQVATASSQHQPTSNNSWIPDPCTSFTQNTMQNGARSFAIALHQSASGLPDRSLSFHIPSRYVMQSGFFGALMANCYALGMGSVDALLIDDGWSVFQLAPDLGYHPSQLSVVRSKFQTLAPDLRPVDVQLTVAHHPYLDVIPFKIFRENALKALERDVLDEDELCKDLVSGGLLCWGSQQKKGLSMETAVPWDARSWEPKVWFLKKYRHLVGGWDDEMWKRARWWHNMRGERIREI